MAENPFADLIPQSNSNPFSDLIPDARAALAQGLREGKRGDQEVYRTTAFRTNQGVPAAGATDAAISGATGGLADEISAGVRAPIDMAIRGEGYDEAYQHNLAAERDRLNQYRKANPIASTVAEVAGGMIMPASKTIGPIKQAIGQGAIYGAGNSEGDLADRAAAALEGGAVSGALGKAVSTVGKAIAGKPPVADTTPKASEIFSTAKPYYREFDKEAADIFVSPKEVIDRVTAALNNGKQPQHLAGEVHDTINLIKNGGKQPSAMQKLEAEMNGLPIPGGENDLVPLTRLRDIKELVGQSFKSNDNRVRAAAGIASNEINKIISEISPGAGEALKKADAIYSTARSVQDLQRKSDVADLRAGRAGYGGNAVNSMRQVLSPIVQRAVEGKNTGYKPNEIQAMRDIVEGTTATNASRGVGQLSPSKGILQTMAGAGATYSMGPAGLAIPAIGMASNKLATILTGKQIDRLKELVAKRSPAYSEAVSKSVEKFEKAQKAFLESPSMGRVAGYVAASRALSSGLTRDGISVSSADIMKSIQGPVASRAENEQ